MTNPSPNCIGALLKRLAPPCSIGLLGAILAGGALPGPARADTPAHNISAGLITVIQNDSGNTTASVTCSNALPINDLRVRDGSNRGDFNVQIGEDPTDDAPNGVLMSSVAENGRDNGEGTTAIYCVSMVDFDKAGTTPGAYLVDVNNAANLGAGSSPEYNINVAAAYFPYSTWIGGLARNSGGTNGGAMNLLTGSAPLVLGTHFIDSGSGKSIVNLTSLGIDSRTDGILLVNGAKNESANYALSQVNSNNGSWNLFIKDDGQATATSFEQDPIAFVFIPRTNTTVVSGRFRGDASISMFSGSSPQFTVTSVATGQYELKIPGRSPTNGVLIISAEGGGAINLDNMVSYQANAAGDGWIIETRDTPAAVLESPGPTEEVVSFVYVPGSTPGFTVVPTNNLFTTEASGTAVFSVVLDTKPSADVTVTVSSSNTAEGTVSTDTLTFTPDNWSVPQIVTVTGQDDAVIDGSVAYTVVLAPATSTDSDYNGRDPVDVHLVNADNEGGITVTPTSGLTTTEAAGTATFTIHLNTRPSADTTIGLSSSRVSEGTVSPSSVTFTPDNWDQDQTVTITGVDDSIDDGDAAYTIITAPSVSSDPTYNGLNAADVSVLNLDNDTSGITIAPTSPTGLTVVEGTTTDYTIVLNSKPATDVVVTIASSNTSQGGTVTPGTLTFTPDSWNVAQAVTIHGIDDTAVDGNTPFTITNTVTSADPLYAALAPATFLVTTLDNEAVLTLPSGDLVYGIGLDGVGIDGRASIVDPNTANYNGGTLTITLTANGTSDDRLEIRNTGSGPGQISVSGNTVSYGGVAIGTFSGGTGTAPLVITFNDAATPTAAEALLRSVTFRNVNPNPTLNRRSVTVVLADSDGGTSSAVTGIRVGLLRATDFQEGADHGYGLYTGESDIQLQESQPDTAFPAGGASGLFIDWPDAGVHNAFNVLLRFTNLFGTGPGQIPTNAVIVSADLYLDINDTGDASPLYRMLIDWDATNATWNSVGLGIYPDDQRARSAFDSQIGTVSANGATTVGTISVSVRPDVLAWQNGDPNYGWVMPGWPGNTDGTGFSPSEAPNISDRPRLRVLWLPAGTAGASFRQGVNDYTNAMDTRIRQNVPDTEFSTVTTVFSDAAVSSTNDPEQVLIQFGEIFGTGPGQIPPGSQIHAAMLDLASVTADAMGDGGQFFALLQPWQDTNSTWNSWTDGIQTDGVEAATTPTAVAGSPTLNPDVQGGFNSFELTADVQAWSLGTRTNYGWVIVPWPGGGNGWGISTSENADEINRPQLRIYYTPAVAGETITLLPLTVTPNNVQVQFTGTVGKTYSILRSAALDGTWTGIGSATVGADGKGTFSDTAPLPAGGFYRISSP